MKTGLASVVFALILGLSLTSTASAQVKGPVVDKILFNAKSQEDLGLMDVASGQSDLWTYGTPGAVFERLPADVKSKLEVYSVSGASYLGLMANPFPNKAPYLSDAAVDASGKARFNPLAMQKIRFALNDLINRQRVVDEILGGIGVVQFTPVVPGLPNSTRFGLEAAKLGMTPTGNQTKALAAIDAALQEASALPELKGRLVKGSPWWTFDAEPVTLQFVIRADDPNARVPLGRYVADQIEKAGIKVERLEYDRVKASNLVNRTDPKTNQWSLYTEGLGANETKAWWEMTMAYMYAPWATIMPGGGKPDNWNYQNPALDKLTQTAVNGDVKNVDEYWSALLQATSLGMKESVRILVAAKTSSQAAAKSRFVGRVPYGLADGINKWSLYAADVKPETSGPDKGKKVLKMTGFSSRGALFMNSWDPVGAQGFGDTYSGMIIKPLSDLELETHPGTGLLMPVRASWSALKTGTEPEAVPATAVLWNTKAQKWEPVAAKTALSQATFTFRFGAWHHGRAVDQNDYRYAVAFPYDLSFDAAYTQGVGPRLARAKGYRFETNGSITVWSDARFPMDQAQLAGMMVPTLQVGAVNSGSVLPWEVLEALKSVVTEGNASGTAWSFNTASTSVEVDVLNPKLIADLKAKLGEFVAARRVPASLAGFVTPAQAVKAYQLTLAWLEAHGHAYISNGAFLLDRYDPVGNAGILTAFRDKSYPFAAGSWAQTLKMDSTRIDAVSVADPVAGKPVVVDVKVSQVAYPANTAVPAGKAQVSVTLMVGDNPTKVTAKAVKPGLWQAQLPAAVVDALAVGTWTIVAESSLGQGDSPGVASTFLLKF